MTPPLNPSRPSSLPKRIALTGGIGTGKSTVQEYLEHKGIPVIDADQITHQLYETDNQLKQIVHNHLGASGFINQDPNQPVDRAALALAAFTQPQLLNMLTDLIHPKVRETMAQFFEEHAESPLAIASIPILYESELQSQYDAVWLVYAPRHTQIERLMDGRGYDRDECERRMAHQIDIEKKRALASEPPHQVIDNSNTLQDTKKAIDAILTPYDLS